MAETISTIEKLFDMDLSALEGIINALDTTMKVSSFISVLPLAILCGGFWLVFAGTKKSTKYSSIGLLLLKIYIIWNVVSFAVAAIGFLIIVIALFVILAQVDALLFNIPVIMLLFGCGYFGLLYLYLYKLVSMVYGIEDTLIAGKNLLYVYTFVIVWWWISGIVAILNSFGAGIWGLIAGIFNGLVFIFLALIFTEYKNEIGLPDINEIKNINKSRRNKNFALQPIEGYVPEFSAAAFGSMRNTLATNASQTNAYNNAAPQNVQGGNAMQNNSSLSFAAAVQYSQLSAQANGMPLNSRNLQVNGETLNVPDDITEELPSRVLGIFGHGDTVDARYTCVGERKLTAEVKCPVKVNALQMYKDAISEKKVLRITCDNVSGAKVEGLVIKVIPRGNYNNALGVISAAEYKFAPAANRQTFLGEFGLPLPENTTNGQIIIRSIAFSDGFTWDKGSEPFVFTTKEKFDFDLDLYSKLC